MLPTTPPTTTATPQPAAATVVASQPLPLATNPAPAAPSSPQKPETTAAQIRHNTQTLIYITAVIAIILVLTNVVLMVLVGSKTKQLAQIKQQIAVKTSDDKNLQSSVDYLAQNQKQLDDIINALPNESRLVEFIDTIESVSSENSNNSTLEFSAIAPASLAQDKYLPFVINLVTDMPNFQQYLTKLEKLPYVIEITSIQAKATDDSSKLWEFTIAARVFVQDPFKS